MYRRGTVSAVDPVTMRARVKFPERENVESFWLEVLQKNTHLNKDEWLPDVGELVAVLLDERGEAGVILGAVYTEQSRPANPSQDVRRVTFSDGASVEYNRATSVLTVAGATKVVVAGQTELEVQGSAKVAGGGAPVARADKVTTALNALKGAISGAVVVPGDGGAAFKANIMAGLGAWPSSVDAEKLTSD